MRFSVLGGNTLEVPSQASKIQLNRLLKLNTVTILEHSTVIPFKYQGKSYYCFYCNSQINTFLNLKQHVESEHQKTPKKSVFINKGATVKIDVASITCKLCNTKVETLDDLVSHLKTTHNKLFYEELGYGVMPYKHYPTNCQCAVCGETFDYYIKLNQHMNQHFGKHVCEICGKSFLNTIRLKTHSFSHEASYPCSYCSEIFRTYSKRKNHYAKAHNVSKDHKCLYCSETFPNYGARTLHLRYAHNVDTPIFDCPVCGKSFRLNSKMKYHLNSVHSK